jgi:hypothetical protein
MARTKQASAKGSRLAQTIAGYKGYSSSKAARTTDQVFSEEVLTGLSDTAATVSRMKRTASGNLPPDVMPCLDRVKDAVDMLATLVADIAPREEIVLDSVKNGQVGEIVDLDAQILEKVGSVNQALSMMDLEAGAGVTPDDLESVCELLDDLGNSLKRRAMLLAG